MPHASGELTPDLPSDPKYSTQKRLGLGMSQIRSVVPGAMILVSAVFSWFCVCRAGVEVATETDWLAASDYVRTHKNENDLIVFAPQWNDPLGRRYLGDQMTIAMAARMDSARYAQIWEVSLPDSSAPEVAELNFDLSKEFGPLRVRRYRQPARLVSYEFGTNWRSAVVTGTTRPFYGLQEVGFEPHNCVLVVPEPGQTVSMRFDAAVLGRELVGYVGLADVFSRKTIRDPGRLTVLIGDESVVSVEAGVDSGWVRFSTDTTPGQATVEFQITALGPTARNRRICFTAEARL